MKILLVAATEKEIQTFRAEYVTEKSMYSIDFLVTGIGMVKAAFALTQALCKQKYDWVINAGIAGAFNREMPLGCIVNVTEDLFSEIGFEDGEKFQSFELGKMFPSEDSIIKNHSPFTDFKKLDGIPKVKGITVNTVHGNEQSISEITKRLSPETESMEGAAFLYVCREMNVKCVQLRSISNYVEKRDKANWNIDLAVTNLNTFLGKIFLNSEK